MGFWHTGYLEFHEDIGLDETFIPAPIRYTCQICNASFESIDRLRKHRFEQHTVRRPMLVLRGKEVGSTPAIITRTLAASEVMIDYCDSVTVNGRPIAIDALAEALTEKLSDRLIVQLRNADVEASFEVDVDIAAESDLHGVDSAFLSLVKSKRLDRHAIDTFIATSRAFPTAFKYCDGICQYLYGVLAKERDPKCSLEYATYRDKFNQSVHELRDYQRPLATVIGALVAFHFNQFEDAITLLPGGRLGAAAKRLSQWILAHEDVNEPVVKATTVGEIEELLMDLETLRIVQWALMRPGSLSAHVDEIQKVIGEGTSEYDRAKLKIILAEQFLAVGNRVDAKRAAQDLIHIPGLVIWAESVLARTGQ